jgi:chemotaxis-related protein WspD
MNAPHSLPVIIDQCWNRIGVKGDQSCPELRQFVHCHNCTVFASAAQLFLDRPVLEDAEDDEARASSVLAHSHGVSDSQSSFSAVVCEVEQQLFAFETRAIVEVTEPRAVHRIGHRTSRVFLGIVNVHGQLELCASLRGLLQIGGGSAAPADPTLRQRMVLLELNGQRWVFPVDAVHGVHRFDRAQVFEIPATTRHDGSSLLKNVLTWNERRVGLLDLEKAISNLNKSLR